jgi:hypothetical protein
LKENIPFVGQLYSMFGDSSSGPSELEMAVQKILNAIHISEQRILDGVNEIFIARDFAGLDAFKERVTAYHIDSRAVRESNTDVLYHLWETSTELKNYFETHTELTGIANSLDSYHAYMSIVALEIMLRSELTTYNYMGTVEESLIPQILESHIQNELAGVFTYVDSIDWRQGARAMVKSTHSIAVNLGNVSGVGGCTIHAEREFTYLDYEYGVSTECSNETGKCRTHLYKGDWSMFGYKDIYYYYQSNIATSCSKTDFHIINDLNNPTRYTAMIDTVVDQIYINLINDGYLSTQVILDNWWGLANYSGERQPNDADNILNALAGDGDNDGLSYSKEIFHGTKIDNPDTDEDGMSDGYEVKYNLKPLDAYDAYNDADYDGLTNLQEYNLNTNPLKGDTDNDGVSDSLDKNPNFNVATIPIINSLLLD